VKSGVEAESPGLGVAHELALDGKPNSPADQPWAHRERSGGGGGALGGAAGPCAAEGAHGGVGGAAGTRPGAVQQGRGQARRSRGAVPVSQGRQEGGGGGSPGLESGGGG
jgi:hypothetical protein